MGEAMRSGSSGLFVVIACALLVTGCGSAGSRIWVPQGSGDVKEDTSSRAPAPAPRRPAPSVAQEEPPAPAANQSPFRNPPVSPPAPARPASAASPPASSPAAVVPGGYTQATRYGDLLFVSGQIGIDP